MVDGALAEHRIELGLLFRRVRVVTGVFEALTLNGALRVSVEYCGRFHAEQVVHSRHDVDSVDVLVSHFTSCWNPCLLYTSPSPRDGLLSRMPSSAWKKKSILKKKKKIT